MSDGRPDHECRQPPIACPDTVVRGFEMEPGLRLPLLLEPVPIDGANTTDALLGWLDSSRDWIAETLLQAGGLLVRGFPIEGAEGFDRVMRTLEPNLLNYTEGQSQRSQVLQKIYTSTEYPPEEDITLHNELSYVHKPPRRIFFFCNIAAETGGQTPIADCRRVFESMDPGIRDAFVEREILYVKNMHGGKGFGKSWQEHFENDDRDAVEQYLQTAGVDYKWKDDGTLWTSQRRPAVTDHPVSGERIWFNQADLWHYSNLGPRGETLRRMLGEENLPTNAYYGDGAPIEAESLQSIRRLFWDQATLFDWQPGDLLILDNLLVSHGRKAFKGKRKILTAMA